jgi:hypothetical protein
LPNSGSYPLRLVSFHLTSLFVCHVGFSDCRYIIEKYDFRVVSSDIKSIPNFIQICPVVLGLNSCRQTEKPVHKLFSAPARAPTKPQIYEELPEHCSSGNLIIIFYDEGVVFRKIKNNKFLQF